MFYLKIAFRPAIQNSLCICNHDIISNFTFSHLSTFAIVKKWSAVKSGLYNGLKLTDRIHLVRSLHFYDEKTLITEMVSMANFIELHLCI